MGLAHLFQTMLLAAVARHAIVAGIYNGQDAVMSADNGLLEFPSFVSIVLTHRVVPGRISTCGGTLYRYRVILTAAHCLGRRIGSIGDWHVKAYLMPRLNPRLIADHRTSLADYEAFSKDQKNGIGVGIAVDINRTLLHQGFQEVSGEDDSVDVMTNDLAMLPLTRPVNSSADAAWAHFDSAIPAVPLAASAGYRALGLGDVGSRLAQTQQTQPEVCFQGKAERLPCRVQAMSLDVLPYADCVRRCVDWLAASSGVSVDIPGAAEILEELGSSICPARLRGVQEGRLLCAQATDAVGASPGDSGGPLLAPGARSLAGVLSWADAGAGSGAPGAEAKMPALYESTAFHQKAIDAAVDCLFPPGPRHGFSDLLSAAPSMGPCTFGGGQGDYGAPSQAEVPERLFVKKRKWDSYLDEREE